MNPKDFPIKSRNFKLWKKLIFLNFRLPEGWYFFFNFDNTELERYSKIFFFCFRTASLGGSGLNYDNSKITRPPPLFVDIVYLGWPEEPFQIRAKIATVLRTLRDAMPKINTQAFFFPKISRELKGSRIHSKDTWIMFPILLMNQQGK